MDSEKDRKAIKRIIRWHSKIIWWRGRVSPHHKIIFSLHSSAAANMVEVPMKPQFWCTLLRHLLFHSKVFCIIKITGHIIRTWKSCRVITHVLTKIIDKNIFVRVTLLFTPNSKIHLLSPDSLDSSPTYSYSHLLMLIFCNFLSERANGFINSFQPLENFVWTQRVDGF